jgi:mannose-6-phosphate isomerase-like protein (cupin superfamily)
MRLIATGKHLREFEQLGKTRRSQAAMMVLAPGGHEGGPDNKHPKSDQWLYVVSGTGWAKIDGKKIKLKDGALLLIEAGERHAIANTGRRKLITVNVYAPPAYPE